jgi:hypothetical protein
MNIPHALADTLYGRAAERGIEQPGRAQGGVARHPARETTRAAREERFWIAGEERQLTAESWR